jgi:hypothetical protein
MVRIRNIVMRRTSLTGEEEHMREICKAKLGVVTALLMAASAASGAVVQATFNDLNVGQLNNQAGGTGFLGGSVWTGPASTVVQVKNNDLVAPPSTGFALTQTGTGRRAESASSALNVDRQRNRPLAAAMTGTIWMSYLVNTNGSAIEIAGVGLNNQSGTSTFNDRPSLLAIGTNLVYNPDRANRIAGSSSLIVTATGALPASGDSLILTRLVIDPNASKKTTFDVWVNPLVTAPLGAPLISVANVIHPRGLSGGGFDGYSELRFLDRVAVGASATSTSAGGKLDLLTISDGPDAYYDVTGLTAPKWTTDGTGSWEEPANWIGGVPAAAGAPANFITALSAASVVTLDVARTVGSLRFDSAIGYTVQGAALTLDNVGTPATISLVSGSHTISSDISAVGGVRVAAGTGSMTAAGLVDVTGTLEVASGELKLTGGTAEMSELLIQASAVLNSTDSSMVIDYTGATPIATVIGYLQSGRLLGNGDDGLGLPTYLAIAEAADLGLTDFDGLAVDETAVVVKFTYVGDANLDGQVDALDYERVDLAIGNAGVLGVAQGDLNYDGNVDALDYEQIDLNIGNGVGTPLAAVFVPEPASMALLLAVPALVGRRRR